MRTSRIRPRSSTFLTWTGCLLLTLTSISNAGPNTAGRWSPADNWGYIPVHMALLPGTGGFHSQVLWWEGKSQGVFRGGLWGWKTPTITGEKDCTAYPDSAFTAVVVDTPLSLIFCSSHAALGNGSVLISGGHENNRASGAIVEVGHNKAQTFNPFTRQWANVDSMEFRRWYGTNTIRPDGTVMTFSGSEFHHAWVWGGRTVPNGVPNTISTNLHRVKLLPDTDWESFPPSTSGSSLTGRDGHSTVPWNPLRNRVVIFGGRDANGNILSDGKMLYREGDPNFVNEYQYSWVTSWTATTPRMRHSAAMTNNTMFVFGGRTSSTIVLARLAQFASTSPTAGTWTDSITSTGTVPSARYGHSAVAFNPGSGWNMYVFGGAGSNDLPIDNDLYVLDCANLSWTTPTVLADSATGTKPIARHGQVLVLDPAPRGHRGSAGQRRMVLFGGQDGSGNRLDDLWVLWLPTSPGGDFEWQKLTVQGTGSQRPSARSYFGADCDRSFARLVLFGGDTGAGNSDNQLWSVDFSNLTKYQSKTSGLIWWERGADHPSLGLSGQTLTYFPQDGFVAQPEKVDPATGSYSTLASGTRKLQQWYPFMFTMPNGNLFEAGPRYYTHILNPTTSTWSNFPVDSAQSLFTGGSAVMYAPGSFMKTGSRDTDCCIGGATSGTTQYITINSAQTDTPWITGSSSMLPRVNHNLTLLPNETVIATGGMGEFGNEENQSPQYVPQIWNPSTKTWSGSTTLEADPKIRGYHSTALLLPDGRILSSGGNSGDPGSQAASDARTGNVFCPPYLFNSQGSLATRPIMPSGAPAHLSWGSAFGFCNVASASTISKVILVRTSTVTHGFNPDQRILRLTTEYDPDCKVLTVHAPADGNLAPPGYYMLFVLNSTGVPSIAKWVEVGEPDGIDPDPCICLGGGFALVSGLEEAGWGEPSALTARTIDGLLSPKGLRIRSDLASKGNEFYDLKLSVDKGGKAALDEVRLVAVDHVREEEVFATNDGFVAGESNDLASFGVEGPSGTQTLTPQMLEERLLSASDIVYCDLGGSGGGVSRLVIEARGELASSKEAGESPNTTLHVEAWRGNRWREVESIPLSSGYDESLISSPGADRFRLRFDNSARIRRLAVVRHATQVTHPRTLELVRAMHSNGEDVKAALGTPDTHSTIVDGEQAIELRFAGGPIEEGMVRDWFLVASGSSDAPYRSPEARFEVPVEPPQAAVFAMGAAVPNPTSGSTTLHFSLGSAGPVSIGIFDVAGRRIRAFPERTMPAGPADQAWDCLDDRGSEVAGGVYFVRIRAQGWSGETKVILLRR